MTTERLVPVVGLWAVGAAVLSACAGGVETGPPLPDADALARTARAEGAIERPSQVRFEWEYGDEKGTLRGDGVARVNPPDSFRIDFFASEGSMQAVLADDSLSTLGQIEDVQLPIPAFLYAMAGVFRPGLETPTRGFATDDGEVLVYERGDDATRLFTLRGGRLTGVEERRSGRVVRRIELEWRGETEWPREAEYRDHLTPSRARWELVSVRVRPSPFPREIYDLGRTP